MVTEIIILGLSIFALAFGIHFWQKGAHLIINGKKAKAVIYKNVFESNAGGNVYYPVVRFLTENKEWITQQLSIGYNPAMKEGTKLEVIYDADDPTNVEINSAFQLEILPRILVTIGVCGLVFGILELLDIVQFINE